MEIKEGGRPTEVGSLPMGLGTVEQSRAEQSRAEQSRAEQSRAQNSSSGVLLAFWRFSFGLAWFGDTRRAELEPVHHTQASIPTHTRNFPPSASASSSSSSRLPYPSLDWLDTHTDGVHTTLDFSLSSLGTESQAVDSRGS
ncbi:uncharacterized protein PG986_010879 [Apiospora aurea]|uniref:Uncharacterized protein n=1 Tax=Apiospora aurea TaxID=335848 RepID=A0ABR1Q3H9_9PEZI